MADNDKVLRTETQYCCTCGRVHDVEIVQCRETNVYRGCEVEYDAIYYRCPDNKDELLDSSDLAMSDNWKAMVKAYQEVIATMEKNQNETD